MNPKREHYARITINGARKSLGFAQLPIILKRVAGEIVAAKSSTKSNLIQIEISTERIEDLSSFDRASEIEQSFSDSINRDPALEVFPGVTVNQMAEAMESSEYVNFMLICTPANRIGIPPETIRETQSAYEDKFPHCAPHFPKWIDS